MSGERKRRRASRSMRARSFMSCTEQSWPPTRRLPLPARPANSGSSLLPAVPGCERPGSRAADRESPDLKLSTLSRHACRPRREGAEKPSPPRRFTLLSPLLFHLVPSGSILFHLDQPAAHSRVNISRIGMTGTRAKRGGKSGYFFGGTVTVTESAGEANQTRITKLIDALAMIAIGKSLTAWASGAARNVR